MATGLFNHIGHAASQQDFRRVLPTFFSNGFLLEWIKACFPMDLLVKKHPMYDLTPDANVPFGLLEHLKHDLFCLIELVGENWATPTSSYMDGNDDTFEDPYDDVEPMMADC